MTIKEFIEKAEQGGFPVVDIGGTKEYPSLGKDLLFVLMLLDPKAWEAVGEAEAWQSIKDYGSEFISNKYTAARYRHTKLIDALWEGKTIEQYLETL